MECTKCKSCGRPVTDHLAGHGHRPQPYMAPAAFRRLRHLAGDGGEPATQQETADRLGLSLRTIQYYESGGRTIPKLVAEEMHRWLAEKAEQAAREA
ncbi:MAG: helix-turn-helix domain-containing protein [Gemmatimonadota bacterium]